MKELIKLTARFMHDRYEFHSKNEKWNTQKKCKVSFSKLPKENKRVMLLVAEDVIKYLDEDYQEGRCGGEL